MESIGVKWMEGNGFDDPMQSSATNMNINKKPNLDFKHIIHGVSQSLGTESILYLATAYLASHPGAEMPKIVFCLQASTI